MGLQVENIVSGISGNPCGCYEEHCQIWPFEVVLHLEPDGTGDAFFDNGDDEIEMNFPATTIEELRARAIEFVKNYYKED